MIRDHDLRLLDAVYRYVRHRPDLFSEAARWLVSGYVDAAPLSGCEGLVVQPASTVESLICDVAARAHAAAEVSESGQADRVADARRLLLVAWLLDERAHPVARGIEESLDDLRPPGLERLPLLDEEEFLALEVKYDLRSDPDWLALVRGAWQVAGDSRYLGERARQDSDGGPTEAKLGRRKVKPSQLRAAQSFLWLAEYHPELVPEGKRKFTKEMHRLLLESDCPAYTAEDGSRVPVPENFATWKRHARAGLQHLVGPSDETEGDPGRSIRRLDEV